MKMVSSFTHPHAAPNLYKFLSDVQHRRRYFEEPNNCWSPIDFHRDRETCIVIWKQSDYNQIQSGGDNPTLSIDFVLWEAASLSFLTYNKK